MCTGVLALGLLGNLSGCARTVNKLPGIYRLDIQQGNVVDQAMLDQLELGMEKRKVQFALGTPLLTDTFNDDRWEYVYSYRRGSKRRVQRRITLFFDGDRLAHIGGDVKVGEERRAPPPRRETMVTVPPAEPPGLFAALMPEFLGGKRAPKLPHEATEPTQAGTETAESAPPEPTPAAEDAESTATALAPDSTAPSSMAPAPAPAAEMAPVETTEPYQRLFTTYGDEQGQQAPGSKGIDAGVTTHAPTPPERADVAARAGEGETPEARPSATPDHRVGEELESVGIPVSGDEQGSFYRRLVDQFREAESVEGGNEPASAPGNEEPVPAP